MKESKRTHFKRLLGKALACGFVLAALASFFPFAAACGQLPQNVVRLHVVANSNSQEDQAVKLLVRDAVLEECARWYQGADSMEEASAQLCTHLQSIAEAARETLREQGAAYSAAAQVTEMYFPTRDYGDFSLPADGTGRCGSPWAGGRGRTGGAWCSPACACPPPVRTPFWLCRRRSGRLWKTPLGIRSNSRRWSCGKACGSGFGGDGAFPPRRNVV